MIKAIFYKEWIKSRWFLLGILLVGAFVEAILLLKIGRSFRYAGHEHLWDVVINKLQVLYSYIKYYPMLAGLVLATAQFVPEINSNRFKLSLHLPYKESTITINMLGYGLAWLVCINSLMFSIFFLGMRTYFTSEIVHNMILTVAPWFTASFLAYFMLAFVLIEPVWKRRIINIQLTVFMLWLCAVKATAGGFQPSIWVLPVLLLISICLAGYSVYRYKTGVQSIYN